MSLWVSVRLVLRHSAIESFLRLILAPILTKIYIIRGILDSVLKTIHNIPGDALQINIDSNREDAISGSGVFIVRGHGIRI